MNRILMVLLLGSAVSLAGCDGGGGSSNGSDRAEVFVGSEIISLVSSVVSESITLDINISIAGKEVTIDDSDGAQFIGELKDDQLTASGVIEAGDVGNGIFCEDLGLDYIGTINEETILGSISGEVICSGVGGSFPFTATGSFRASSTEEAGTTTARQAVTSDKRMITLMKSLFRQ